MFRNFLEAFDELHDRARVVARRAPSLGGIVVLVLSPLRGGVVGARERVEGGTALVDSVLLLQDALRQLLPLNVVM